MQHRYLFTLEVTPLKTGKAYNELPSHLTLMSRFFSDLPPHQIKELVKPLFEQTKRIDIVFKGTGELGPKRLIVHVIEHSNSLKQLHNSLRTLLNSINVEYEYPQFIGENHKPHVTKREGIYFKVGNKKVSPAAYLVKVIEGKRVIRAKFPLLGDVAQQSPHEPMLVFISGSINSGKTTTAMLLAQRLNADFINVDDLNDRIPNFNLATDLDKSMDLAILEINKRLARGKSVVANYVVRQKDYDRFKPEINAVRQYVFTLAPRLEVAQSKRGGRTLTDWEVQRIKHHYDTGIASPIFGFTIDNSDLTLDQTVDKILEVIK